MKVPAYIQSIAPYQGGLPISEVARQLGCPAESLIKLASNENPLGPSPAVREALASAAADINRYPDGNGFELKAAIAAHFSCDPKQITLGNGSNDILELVVKTFATPADAVMYSEFSFAVYALATQAAGAIRQVVPARDYGHDLEAMRAAITPQTRVIFIANPNNPTGTFLTGQALCNFLDQVPATVIVVLDEAYTEYLQPADQSHSETWLVRYPNLIISRTFSKAYGLAGLRVGFGLSAAPLADYLNRVRQPFNVNSLAQAGAIAALADADYVSQTRKINQQGYLQWVHACDELQLHYVPSFANFILIQVARDAAIAAQVNQALLQKGIIVRPVASYGLVHHLRISIGLPQENQKAITALKQIYSAHPDWWRSATLD